MVESLVIAIPVDKENGHTLATINIEYEWNPPRCSTCMIFDHHSDKCPKLPKVAPAEKVDEEGFVEVKKKKHKNKNRQTKIAGVRLSKPQPQFRHVDKGEPSKQALKDTYKTPEISVSNSYGPLNNEDDNDTYVDSLLKQDDVLNFSDGDLDEELQVGRDGKITSNVPGASTPLSMCAILESHAKNSNLVKLCTSVFKHWDWTSNGNLCSKGTRIIIGWNKYDVDVSVISQSDQVIHVRLWLRLEKKELFCSFIYGHNRYSTRRVLWNNLCAHNHFIRQRPWCMLGDFNAALNLDDSTASSSRMDIAMREFKECIDEIEVKDISCTGLHYTWTQKPRGFDGLFKKIDRVMGNNEFINMFMGAHAIFKPYRISDHAPAMLVIPTVTKPSPKPFKFANVTTSHSKFKEVVSEGWNMNSSGFWMFRLVKKLKNLKNPLRKLLHEHGNFHDNVVRLRAELDKVQTDLDLDPFNLDLREEEVAYVQAYNQAIVLEERFLQQKAKVLWLKEGDSNSAFFHKAVKGRVSRNRIDVVTDVEGNGFANENVSTAFVTHYESFLGQEGITSPLNTNNLFDKVLSSNMADDMILNVSDKEIKDALFSMGNRRLGRSLVMIPNQSAFVPDRSITDNILLTHELMHNYHLDRGDPRCAFKVDIQKAYDTVDWNFLKAALTGFGFHEKMILWIMECVTTTSFSISLNGSFHGHFK
ncbi:sugar transport protein 13, partial [Tanacetum coccineum]